MRITIPVSGDGDAWMSHMPEINFNPESMLDANGKIILSKVTDLLHQANKFHEEQFGRQMFMIGSGDGFNTYSMTVEFLRQLAAVTHWIENRPGSKAHVSSNESMQDRRLERRMSRDQVAFCRIDIRNVSTGVKFIIGYGNPMNKVIGNCEGGAREFAIYVTRIILNLAETVNALSRDKNAGLRVSVEGRDQNLIPEARRREADGRMRDRRREANAKRTTCANNVGGFCSPSCPSCPCYHNGKCVELEV